MVVPRLDVVVDAAALVLLQALHFQSRLVPLVVHPGEDEDVED